MILLAEKELEITVNFEVKKIRFRNNESGYSVLEVLLVEGFNSTSKETVVVGKFNSVSISDTFEGFGTWTDNEKHGKQFSLKSYKKVLNSSAQIISFNVKFEIKKIRYRNEETGYTVLEGRWISYPYTYLPTSELVMVGFFLSVLEEDEFEGEGYWVNDKTFGCQFKLTNNKRILPQSLKGIKSFLTRFVRGIGNKTADKIVDYYKEDTISKIEESFENLMKIPGIGEKKAKKIHEKISENNRMEDVSIFVLSNGFGYKVATKIYDLYKDGAIIKIKENPYCLSKDKKLGFLIADKFAKNLNLPYDNKERIKEGLNYYLRIATKSKGDLYVYKDKLLHSFPEFLDKYGAYKDEKSKNISLPLINEALEILITDGEIVIEKDKKYRECVYLKSSHIIENKIVKTLKRIIEEPNLPLCSKDQIQEFINKYEETYGLKLASKQVEAVFMSLQNGLSILTGGPGTGKTQTINTIIQCIKYVKPQALINLSAPTGKASKRMTELTNMDAQTIHRLIKLNGFDVENQLDKIEGDFLIIDESSMIDAYVFFKLLEATDENTRILFVGDYEQLPSVGPGLILRDLINSNKIPTTTLNEIFRQAKESQIVMNSHKIIKGIKTTDKDGLSFDAKKEDFYFIERTDRIKTQKAIIECVKRFVDNGLYSLSDIQILSPMKKGDLGVHNLNRIMQQTFNPPANTKSEMKINETTFFRVGDRVIQTTNNYELTVFNGEVGVVTAIYRDDNDDLKMEVDFDNKIVEYDEFTAEELLLAYVITIHKSQGSEFPIVIMPIHDSQALMLNKNLIYTAWTRAKKTVVVVGSKKVLDNSITVDDNTVRNSKIKEKIIENIN
ncbi:MAG: hypothetical protein K0R54_44 [Clostridiaceae bacterium]|nr:hypothetical protein [Clostridiaceae bacterium]